MSPKGGPSMRRSALAANPVLIGAATVLVAIVAVVLAYNANSGLPFVKTYVINAEVPDAAGLIVGNDVRKGGSRVGFVSKVVPRPGTDGTQGATVQLKLDLDQKPLPADSKVEIRPRSVLGLKYVQLTAGRSKTQLADGQTIDLRYAGAKPVELDDLFDTFDEPTRTSSSANLIEAGTTFAGRGDALNRTIAGLQPLLERAEPALRNLNDPATALDRLFPALLQAADEVAPVATSQANLVTGLRRTLDGLDAAKLAIQDSISYGPRALKAGTEELPKQAAILNASTELFRRLRPALASLSNAAPGLARAETAGITALRRSPQLNGRLVTTLQRVERFGTDGRTLAGLGQVRSLAATLRPTTSFVAPAQTVCNYATLLTRNLASALGESDTIGSSLKISPLILPIFPNAEANPSGKPADGPADAPIPPVVPGQPRKQPQPADSFLHSNPYPNTAAPGQPRECEAGNELYVKGRQAIGNTPRNDGAVTELQQVGRR